VSRADVRATQGFSVAAIDNLLRVAGSVVVEGAGPDDASVVRAYTAVGEQRTFVIGTGPTPRTPEVGLQPPDNDLDADAWGAFGEALVARLRARRKALGSPDASENVPEDLRTRTLIALIDLEAALRGLQAEGGRPADSRGQRFQPLRRLLSEAIEEGILPQLDFEEADEIVAVRNALVHGARDAVPEHRLPHVLDRAVGLLQQIQPYLLGQTGAESGQDLEPILARYESEAPEWPHRNLSQQLLELGYLPNTVASPPRSYIRWLYAGHRGRVSLHQVEDGLLLDSRVHKAFAARLPGADVRGRRVFFVYQRLTLEQIVSAAERLRRQVAD
jgi:hypothetical protein